MAPHRHNVSLTHRMAYIILYIRRLPAHISPAQCSLNLAACGAVTKTKSWHSASTGGLAPFRTPRDCHSPLPSRCCSSQSSTLAKLEASAISGAARWAAV